MTAPPTWLLVVLAVALVVAVLASREYAAEAHRRNVEPSLNGTDADGHFRSMTLAEANAERAARGDVPIEPYTWRTYLHDKREDFGFVFGALASPLSLRELGR